MWAPLSRTPICLDTLCCRLDNGSISLGEAGPTILWKAVPVAWHIPTLHGVTPSPGLEVVFGIFFLPVSLWVLVTRALHELCLLSHA